MYFIVTKKLMETINVILIPVDKVYKEEIKEFSERRIYMRIEAYNQVNSVYQTNKVLKAEKVSKSSATDAVHISSVGQDYQIAKKAISETSDVRAEIVNSIKKRMETGTYEVSSESFADKLMEKMNEMR